MKFQPLLPLEIFRDRIGFNPWHFYQWRDGNLLSQTGACDPVLLERQSQSFDRAGREDFRQALVQAENMIFDLLGYLPAPRYEEDTIEWPRLADSRMMRGDRNDADWRWLNMEVPHHWVRAVGVRALTPVSLNQAVVYTDEDGDGYPDMATLGPIALPAGVVASEIALYYSVADRLGLYTDLNDETWRIEPVYTAISGNTFTVKLRPWMLARPVLYEGVNPQHLDPAVSGNFVSTLDVYRRYTNSDGNTTDTSQATIIWETRPSHGWWCLCSSCISSTSVTVGSLYDPAATSRAIARAGIRDSEKGLVTPAESVLDTTSGVWASFAPYMCDEPDRVTVRYLAGFPLDSRGQMDSRMQEVVVNLAAAELWRPICGCQAATRAMDYLQYDVTRIGSEQELYQVTDRAQRNLFGTRRGHVIAWQKLAMIDNWSGLLV